MSKSPHSPLAIMIDTIAKAREDKKRAEDIEEKLKPSLERYGLEKGTYDGVEYVLTVGDRVESNYSVSKTYKLLGIRGLEKCVKIVVGKLKTLATLAQLDGLIEGEPVVKTTYSFARKNRNAE